MLLVASVFVFARASYAAESDSAALRILVAQTIFETGVIQALLGDFSKIYPKVKFEIQAAGALNVIDTAAEGKADVIINHYPRGEALLMQRQIGVRKVQFMSSHFVVFGPHDDEYNLVTARDLGEVLQKLIDLEERFLISHPRSGTFQRFSDLLVLLNLPAEWQGYENTLSPVQVTFSLADQEEAFTFGDISNFFVHRDQLEGNIAPLFRDDAALVNNISALIVGNFETNEFRKNWANQFVDFLVSSEAQMRIEKYGEENFGAPVFKAIAHLDAGVQAQNAQRLSSIRYRQVIIRNVLVGLLVLALIILIFYMVRVKRLDAKRKFHEDRFHLAITGISDGFWHLQMENNTCYVSQRFKEITGVKKRGDVIHHADEALTRLIARDYREAFADELKQCQLNGKSEINISSRLSRDDTSIPVRINASVIRDNNGRAIEISGTLTDVSFEEAQQDQIEHYIYQALHDSLTGLPNRFLLQERLEQAGNNFKRNQQPFSIVVMDLDKFKEINDTLGHHVGDLVLIRVAEVLSSCARQTDTISRFGGDEFVLLFHNASANITLALCRKIHAKLQSEKFPQHQIASIQSSIGIVSVAEHNLEIGQLLQAADKAMYTAKNQGGGCAVYS